MTGTIFSSDVGQTQEHQKTCFLDALEADKHLVVIISSSIIKFAEQYLDLEMRLSVFSPQPIEVDLPYNIMTLGTIAIVMGFLARFFESASFIGCLTGNKMKFVNNVLTKIENHSNSLTLDILVGILMTILAELK